MYLRVAMGETKVALNRLARYLLIASGVAVVCYVVWYFSDIFWFIIISAVLSLIGQPLANSLARVRVGRFHIPRWLGSLLVLSLFISLFVLFLGLVFPLIYAQFQQLAQLDVRAIAERIRVGLGALHERIAPYLPEGAEDFSLLDSLWQAGHTRVSGSFFANVFASTASFVTSLLVALFSIAFITFFFLKEEGLFTKGFKFFFPSRYHDRLQSALTRIEYMLRRYFVGLLIQSTAVGTLVLLLFKFVLGLPFGTCVVIAVLAGVLNLIPYIGPTIALLLSVAFSCSAWVGGHVDFSLLTTALLAAALYGTVSLVDNVLFQPLIFSTSAKAHPLEIFIILLMAGFIGGMVGMVVAIPAYTVIRVFLKEFFNHYRQVQQLTKNL